MNSPDRLSLDEARRLAVLRDLGVLDSGREAAFDALAACAARLAGCSVALIGLVDAERVWLKAAVGLELHELPRELAFGVPAVAGAGPLVVEDLAADPRFAAHPLVRGAPRLRFHAGQPLRVDGAMVGMLSVLDPAPRTLDTGTLEALAQLGRATVELLQSRRRTLDATAQRERLLDFARAAGDWMWESDAEHRYLWLSDAFEAQTGLPAAAVLGRRIEDAELLDEHGEPRPGRPRLHALLAAGRAFTRVLSEKETPHGPMLVSRSAVPVHAADGRFAGYRGTARNVSATVAAAAAARRSQATLRLVAAQLPGALFTYQKHADGRRDFPFVSDSAARLLGVDAGALQADPALFFRLVHPDDRAPLRRAVEASAATLRPLELRYRIVRPDGALRWLESRAAPVRQPDGSTLSHGFTADVTERHATEAALREAEERWRLAAESAGIGIAHLRRADGQVRLDARACEQHGLAHPHGPLGLHDWLAQVDPADRDAADAAVRRALTGGTPFEARLRVRRPDGTVRWLEFVVRATRADGGAIDGLIGICRDVHEPQVAGELQRQKHEAERANRAKSEFLSRLSHELFTPLNAILGFAQLMALDGEQPLPAAQARRLDSVRQAGKHLLALTDDMLAWSAIERSEFRLPIAPVDVDAALRAALAVSRPLLDERGVTLPPPPASGACARGDALRLEQLLAKLVTHAARRSQRGQMIMLSVAADECGVALRIEDRGEPIRRERLERLFQPFGRLAPDQPLAHDTGLGLVIARRLAELMEGTLEVESGEPGGGTGLRFVLRLRRCEDAPQPAEEGVPRNPPASPAADAGRRVLYIEDEPLNQVLLTEVFRARPSWRLEIAADGASGLAALAGELPDLVLMDMNLPDSNGRELIARVRAEPRTAGLRCIALSADAMREQIEAARRAGFDDYWTKPIDVARVLGALDQLLGAPVR